MKRILAIILTLVMLLTLCACKKDDTQGADMSTGTGQTDSSESTNSTAENEANEENTTDAEQNQDSTGSTSGTSNEVESDKEQTNTQTPVGCSHTYADATCTAPKTCTKCGATEGNAEHSWKNATCTAPKTCTKCSATEGSTAEHNYSNGACTACGAKDPNVPFTNNRWEAYIVLESGDLMVHSLRAEFGPESLDNTYGMKTYYASGDSEQSFGTLEYNGKTYYDLTFSGSMGGFSYTDDGNTVTIDQMNGVKIEMKRTSATQFTVTSCTRTEWVGAVFSSK